MSEEEIFEKLRDVLCGFLEVEEDDVTLDSSLKDDLDLDIESELTAEDFENAETVQDLVDEIKRRLED